MNHHTDPRTMENRWRSMGWRVEWSDDYRAYCLWSTTATFHVLRTCRTVNEVEAYVTAHASGRW